MMIYKDENKRNNSRRAGAMGLDIYIEKNNRFLKREYIRGSGDGYTRI